MISFYDCQAHQFWYAKLCHQVKDNLINFNQFNPAKACYGD
ncbi:hypothetical protein AO366_1265 [Moraxella catarrhalis]|nr:hypothetical protein AO366_1265 [Moraxella catarrhalis]